MLLGEFSLSSPVSLCWLWHSFRGPVSNNCCNSFKCLPKTILLSMLPRNHSLHNYTSSFNVYCCSSSSSGTDLQAHHIRAHGSASQALSTLLASSLKHVNGKVSVNDVLNNMPRSAITAFHLELDCCWLSVNMMWGCHVPLRFYSCNKSNYKNRNAAELTADCQ